MDVYLNARRDLLVVKTGSPIPAIVALGNWHMSKKRRVVKVSEVIRSALEEQGYYTRNLKDGHRRG